MREEQRGGSGARGAERAQPGGFQPAAPSSPGGAAFLVLIRAEAPLRGETRSIVCK